MQQTRADLGLKLYAGQKWGTCRFVRGGYLVGDKIEETKPFVQIAAVARSNDSALGDSADAERASKSKLKRSKEEEEKKKKSKKAAMTSSASESERQAETKEERRLRKAERRAKKEEKRRRQGQEIGSTTEGSKNDTTSSAPSPSSTGFSTPTGSGNESAGWAVVGAVGHRQAVRQRFIRQKKMASLDPQALKEVSRTTRSRVLRATILNCHTDLDGQRVIVAAILPAQQASQTLENGERALLDNATSAGHKSWLQGVYESLSSCAAGRSSRRLPDPGMSGDE